MENTENTDNNIHGKSEIGKRRSVLRLCKIESVLSTRTSSEFVYEFSEDKGQFARIRDENIKFHSVYTDCPNSIPYSMF